MELQAQGWEERRQARQTEITRASVHIAHLQHRLRSTHKVSTAAGVFAGVMPANMHTSACHALLILRNMKQQSCSEWHSKQTEGCAKGGT